VDYVAIPPTTLTFPAGEVVEFITVTINAAPNLAPTRTFTVNLSSPTGGATIGDGQGTGTILNPNGPPAILINNASVIGSDTDTTTATFFIRLSPPSTQTVTATYATADGTAKAGVDYVAIPPTPLVFTRFTPFQVVKVTVNPVPTAGPRKTFTL